MERKTIRQEIVQKYVDEEQPRWKDLKNFECQDNDLIHIGYDDNHDGGWFITIERERLETDEEYSERMKYHERLNEDSKKRRYENYLKLKEEFEN